MKNSNAKIQALQPSLNLPEISSATDFNIPTPGASTLLLHPQWSKEESEPRGNKGRKMRRGKKKS